jgi:hypothetical protein
MRPKQWLDRLLTLKVTGVHDDGSVTAQPAELHSERCNSLCAAWSRAFYLFVLPADFKVEAEILNRKSDDDCHRMADRFCICGPHLANV